MAKVEILSMVVKGQILKTLLEETVAKIETECLLQITNMRIEFLKML